MLKRLISAVLAVAFVALVPILLAGCEEPKRKITLEKKRDIEEVPVKREMVVD